MEEVKEEEVVLNDQLESEMGPKHDEKFGEEGLEETKEMKEGE